MANFVGLSRVRPGTAPRFIQIGGIIQEVNDCWAFSGSKGRLVLALPQPSQLTGVSLSHVPTTLSITGDIASAPRQFLVMAHQQEDDLENGFLLGEFEYSNKGPWRQSFPLLVSHSQRFRIIEFRFLTNHGNPDYTCIYRVHVHGTVL